jgi:hypothetical protein
MREVAAELNQLRLFIRHAARIDVPPPVAHPAHKPPSCRRVVESSARTCRKSHISPISLCSHFNPAWTSATSVTPLRYSECASAC